MVLQSVIVVGGGMAGFTTVRDLRARGFQGTLTLVDPDGLPYDRPPLSKDYLTGRRTGEQIQLAQQSWFEEQDVCIVSCKAVALRPDEGIVLLENGQELAADKMVLATGGAARRLDIPGGDLDSVLELRTRADADRLRSLLHPGVRLCIIGAGLIGAEAASSAVAFGAAVTLIDPVDPPLVPAVGLALAKRLHNMHLSRGIRLVTGVPLAISVEETGHCIVLDTGEEIAADLVLTGIGIVPETTVAASAGLVVDDGTLVDDHQRTSHPNVYAVGDSARLRLPDGTLRRREEHWEHAIHTGSTAAAAMLGQDLPVHGTSWFWSDRHGVHVEGAGSMLGEGAIVVREKEGVAVASFRLQADGTMAGCAAIDGGLTVRAARRIIDRRIRVDPASLANPAVDLKKLAR